jgi:hypothetical protein
VLSSARADDAGTAAGLATHDGIITTTTTTTKRRQGANNNTGAEGDNDNKRTAPGGSGAPPPPHGASTPAAAVDNDDNHGEQSGGDWTAHLASWLAVTRHPSARETEAAFRPLAAALRRKGGGAGQRQQGLLPSLALVQALAKQLARVCPPTPLPRPAAAATAPPSPPPPLLPHLRAAVALALDQVAKAAADAWAQHKDEEGARLLRAVAAIPGLCAALRRCADDGGAAATKAARPRPLPPARQQLERAARAAAQSALAALQVWGPGCADPAARRS